MAIPQERLEMKEEFLSRLVKLTSLENPKNQYEIEVASDQSDQLADSNIL